MRRASVRAIAAIGATLVLAGCGGGGAASPGASATPSPVSTPAASALASGVPSQAPSGAAACELVADGATGTAVAASGFAFAPDPVSVAAGAAVTWTNGDGALHTVTLDDGSCDSGTFGAGTSVTLRFMTPGTYGYLCEIHPAMTGTVEVTG